MNQEISIITYPKLLQKLESSKQANHLLLGNGFNNSLGIATDYQSIFKRMLDKDPIYQGIQSEIEQEKYDIEKLIGRLKGCLKNDQVNSTELKFLNNYIERKVKYDFMKATSGIVRDKVAGIYQEKNKEVYLLFKNFSNYFTLNYDTFLYLLLMKFKKVKNSIKPAVAFQNTSLFQQEDLNQSHHSIYDEIQRARKDGRLIINVDDTPSEIDMKNLAKGYFQTIIKSYAKANNKPWSVKDIEKVCNLILENERNEHQLENLSDGFIDDLFKDNYSDDTQNIFFLHGSFHIYKDKQLIKKITQKQDKALYERLEEIIDAEDRDIVCVLANDKHTKEQQIGENKYLKKCFDKLSGLSGSIVILGSSLAENDQHIFDAISQSQIDNIYISSCNKSKKKDFSKSKELFSRKSVILFDYETISYSVINKEKA